ncbi:MAG: transporter substrate-binding domain-containing protein [Crocosphaera sp.]|nr:transporter substrate-binding domain-containing protein [Crocosphaera sp.]
MFPSPKFFIGLALSNVVVFFLVRILLVILSSFDVLNFVDILNLFDISNLNIIFSLLITDLTTIIVHSIFRNHSVLINQINLVFFQIPSVNVPLSVLVFVSALIIFLLSFSTPFQQPSTSVSSNNSQSSSQQETVSEPDDSFYFGYIPDASPISNKQSNLLLGYCRELKDYLEENNHPFKIAEIQYANRFTRKAKAHDSGQVIPEDKLIIECSANTITEERSRTIYDNGGGHFSDPFAKTGAKLLIRKNSVKSQSLNPQNLSLPLQHETIGIIGKTTTRPLIKSVYTNSNLESYSDRGAVIDALNDRKLNIYPSDGILLKYMLESPKSSLEQKEEYMIWPEHFLSHENYGVVVYGVFKDYKTKGYDSKYRVDQDRNKQNEDKEKPFLFDGEYAELFNTINQWINGEGGKQAYNKHIDCYDDINDDDDRCVK